MVKDFKIILLLAGLFVSFKYILSMLNYRPSLLSEPKVAQWTRSHSPTTEINSPQLGSPYDLLKESKASHTEQKIIGLTTTSMSIHERKKTYKTPVITSPYTTKVTLVGPKPYYHVGEQVKIVIEARDDLNRTKLFGGDMFRLKLCSENPYAAVGADSFVDHQNGTYSASFPLLWEGTVSIKVMLSHPAEAIPLLRPTLNGSRAHLEQFSGDFETNGKNGTSFKENTPCSQIKNKGPLCNFSDTQNYAPWFCTAPRDEHLNCRHLRTYHTNVNGLVKALESCLHNTVDKMLLVRSRKMVDHTIGTLQIMPATDEDKIYHLIQSNLTRDLPYCFANGPPPLRTNGYYYADKWIPFGCKVRVFSRKEIKRCLTGKTLHFFGDSTARQFYEFLQEEIGCEDIGLPPPRITSTREFRCSIDQIILHFHFHGLPNGQSKPIPSWSNHYVASEIDNLKGGTNTIIFLSLWAHFAMTGLPFYEERIRSIRESLHRLQSRSNGTSVFVKGVNTRDYWKKQFILVSSDWHSLKQEQKLRELFQNDTNFGYIDPWEITNVQPFPDQTHPDYIIIKNLVNRLMTYICIKETF